MSRPLPATTADTLPFWTGGARGELLIQQCDHCSYYIHPPTGFCPRCGSREVHYQPVSGRGSVATFTINYKQWMPGLEEPYVLALVRLAEADHVLLAANIERCPIDAVTFGMAVKVFFEQAGDLWIPLFEPATAT